MASPASDRPVAFVTGASRGIGKVVATELAAAGHDVAITARTVAEGESREHSSTIKKSNTSPLPGALATTASEIEAHGSTALVVPADLLDLASLESAVAATLDRFGRIDVLVNNGRYIGPGHMDRILETPIELLDLHLRANVLAAIRLVQLVVPGMLERGKGTIVDITSAAGYADPTAPAGDGGWGLGYGMSKAAFHRIAGVVAVELGAAGIRAYNVQPGLIATERIAADMAEFGFANVGAPPAVVAKVARWLVEHPDGEIPNGATVEAQYFCHAHALLPGWSGPEPNTAAIAYDCSGARLADLEADLLRRSAG